MSENIQDIRTRCKFHEDIYGKLLSGTNSRRIIPNRGKKFLKKGSFSKNDGPRKYSYYNDSTKLYEEKIHRR